MPHRPAGPQRSRRHATHGRRRRTDQVEHLIFPADRVGKETFCLVQCRARSSPSPRPGVRWRRAARTCGRGFGHDVRRESLAGQRRLFAKTLPSAISGKQEGAARPSIEAFAPRRQPPAALRVVLTTCPQLISNVTMNKTEGKRELPFAATFAASKSPDNNT